MMMIMMMMLLLSVGNCMNWQWVWVCCAVCAFDALNSRMQKHYKLWRRLFNTKNTITHLPAYRYQTLNHNSISWTVYTHRIFVGWGVLITFRWCAQHSLSLYRCVTKIFSISAIHWMIANNVCLCEFISSDRM